MITTARFRTVLTLLLCTGLFTGARANSNRFSPAGRIADVEGDDHLLESRTGIPSGADIGVQDFFYSGSTFADGWLTFGGDYWASAEVGRFNGVVDLFEKGRYQIQFNSYRRAYFNRSEDVNSTELWADPFFFDPHLRRMELTLGAEWELPNGLFFRLEYSHQERIGEKPSSRQGVLDIGNREYRGTLPAFLLFDEKREIVEAELGRESGAKRDAVLLRYEQRKSDNHFSSANQIKADSGGLVVGEDARSDSEIFSIHSRHRRQVSDQIVATAGASYFSLEGLFAGGRIFSEHYDPAFAFDYGRLGEMGLGYLDLSGENDLRQYRLNANLSIRLGTRWVLLPSVLMERTFREAASAYLSTERRFFAGATDVLTDIRRAGSDEAFTEGTGRVELRRFFKSGSLLRMVATGRYGEGDLTEFLDFRGVEEPESAFERALFHKADYRRETLQLRASYRQRMGSMGTLLTGLDYTFRKNVFDRVVRESQRPVRTLYPSYLRLHESDLLEGHFRWTVRPLKGLMSVTQIRYQTSRRDSAAVDSTAIRSGTMHAWIIGQSVTFQPHPKWLGQLSLNYTRDRRKTPVADLDDPVSEILPEGRSDYFTAQLNGTFYFTDKTDMELSARIYFADNFPDFPESAASFAYDLKEWEVGAGLRHRWNQKLSTRLRVTYHDYRETSPQKISEFKAVTATVFLTYQF